MGGTGNSLAALKLFEAQIIPALLHNCESWIWITQTHVSDLLEFHDKFIRKLLIEKTKFCEQNNAKRE